MAYIMGIVMGAWYIDKLNKKPPVIKNLKPFDDLMVWAIIGIVAGGRMGYVLFYNLSYYAVHPFEALQVWHGGMSFHGGLIGFVTAIYILCRKQRMPFLGVMDLCACVAPLGLFFGRIANFINGELYGRITDSPFGMIFPNGGDKPRHPSQLYEAFLEGLVLFIILFCCIKFTRARGKVGMMSGIFLLGYSIARTVVENFREPDEQVGFIFGSFTMGQLLSVPMVMLGAFLVFRAAIKGGVSAS